MPCGGIICSGLTKSPLYGRGEAVAMLPYFSEFYGNPSSIYDFAQKSKEAVTKGRQQIADVLNAKKEWTEKYDTQM